MPLKIRRRQKIRRKKIRSVNRIAHEWEQIKWKRHVVVAVTKYGECSRGMLTVLSVMKVKYRPVPGTLRASARARTAA